MDIFFSDHFKTKEADLEKYGAFNISLVADLPLFIDPFLLFNSKKKKYKQLHDEIIKYLVFLKEKSTSQTIDTGALKARARRQFRSKKVRAFSNKGQIFYATKNQKNF